ncbi:MAG: hypothetical protein LBS99_03715, partial [Clostridiales bacterium]|nr:hypothetical protein [Clostridiales bacterium]
AELSEGRRFGDDADEIYTDFAEADLIAAHNFPFDFQFMSAEMARAGRTFHYKNSLCTMRRLTPVMKLLRSDGRNYKYPRLAEMRDYLGITAGDILSLGERLYGETGGFHDARYDAMVVFSAFMRLQETMTDISDMIIKAVNE